MKCHIIHLYQSSTSTKDQDRWERCSSTEKSLPEMMTNSQKRCLEQTYARASINGIKKTRKLTLNKSGGWCQIGTSRFCLVRFCIVWSCSVASRYQLDLNRSGFFFYFLEGFCINSNGEQRGPEAYLAHVTARGQLTLAGR